MSSSDSSINNEILNLNRIVDTDLSEFMEALKKKTTVITTSKTKPNSSTSDQQPPSPLTISSDSEKGYSNDEEFEAAKKKKKQQQTKKPSKLLLKKKEDQQRIQKIQEQIQEKFNRAQEERVKNLELAEEQRIKDFEAVKAAKLAIEKELVELKRSRQIELESAVVEAAVAAATFEIPDEQEREPPTDRDSSDFESLSGMDSDDGDNANNPSKKV